MFSFRRRPKNPSIHKVIRKFLSAVHPELGPSEREARWEYRLHRTAPVLLAPYDDELSLGEASYALTKNLSDSGLALVLPQPFRAERLAVGFWFGDQAHFVLAQVRQNVPLGGGFWQLGVELLETLDPAQSPMIRRMLTLAARLDPRLNQEALAANQLIHV